MFRACGDGLIENIPVPEPAIAPEIKLPGANAAHGHADIFEFAAAQDFRGAALEKRFDPLRRKFFVGRHQMAKILAREWSGHGGQAGEGQPEDRGGGRF